MKVRKKWTPLSVRRATTQFMLLIITAIVIYVCLNLVSSSSTMSLKVDMFIKMQGLNSKKRDSSRNSSYQPTHNNKPSDVMKPDKIGQRNTHRLDNQISSNSYKVYTDIGDTVPYSNLYDDVPVQDSINFEDTGHSLRSKSKDGITYDHLREIAPENQIFQLSDKVVINSNNTEEYGENKTKKIDIFGNIENGTDKDRKLDCDECFKHYFKYVIENDVCKVTNSDQTIDLIVLITTSHKNTKARTALRATWLSYAEKNTGNVRYAFLLGKHVESRYNELIVKENKLHHDIIQEDFIDSYLNLTYKTIMGFKWAATKCAHAQFVMKTDDDMFVNLPNVLRIIDGPLGEILESSVAGSCTQKAKPIRHKQSKWYASIESYPQPLYPGFCSGTGYLTSINVASKVYLISPSVPFFHLEDVYVALCLRKLGFRLQRVPGFNMGRRRLDPCVYKGRFLITAHHMSPSLLQMIWKRHCTRMQF